MNREGRFIREREWINVTENREIFGVSQDNWNIFGQHFNSMSCLQLIN